MRMFPATLAQSPIYLKFNSIQPMETTQGTFDPIIRENPMGEARKDGLRLDLDLRLKLKFHCDEPFGGNRVMW